jgi:hypothetical protein
MLIINECNIKNGWMALNKIFVQQDDSAWINWNTTKCEYYLGLRDVYLMCESIAGDFCLEDIGYSTSGTKVTNLVHKYLDKERTNQWLDEITRWKNRDTPYFLPTKESDERYPGNCLIGFNFRLSPKPHLSVISRAVEMPHKGGADLLFFSGLARILRERLEINNIELGWYMDAVWITSKTARVFLIQQYPKKVVYQNEVFQKGVKEGWDKFFLSSGKMTGHNRMQKFFQDEKAGTNPRTINGFTFYKSIKEYLDDK